MIISEKRLLAACVALSIAGIVALFVMAAVAEPHLASVKEAGSGSPGGKVRVAGFVDSVRIWENHAVIKIAALESVDAVSFDPGYIEGLNLERFQEVEVSGELRSYKGENSLIVSKLRLRSGITGSKCGG